MWNKILLIIMVLSILISIAIGVFFRQTYTNVTEESDVFGNFSVALWDLDISPNLVETMRKDLPNSKLIIRVKANGLIGYSFKNNKQYVEVLEVYQGDELDVGDQIAITSLNWLFFFDNMNANLGFVNVMQHNHEYLVFLEGKLDTLDHKENVYFLPDLIVAPLFNYQDMENTIISVPENNRYVPYEKVRKNEFLVSSEEALRELIELKHELLKRYPR